MPNSIPIDTHIHSSNWLFWLRWVAASTAGVLLSLATMYVLIFLAKAILPSINEDRFFGQLMFPVLGIGLGTMQWFVLRERIHKSGWWILATLVGMLLGVALCSGVVQAVSRITGRLWNWDDQPGILMIYALMGLSLALVQLAILWRHTSAKFLWIVLNLAGWLTLGQFIGKSIDRTSDIFILGAIPAAFNGIVLIDFFRKPHKNQTSVT